MRAHLLVAAIVTLMGAASIAACAAEEEATALTKPQSPADGAGDYKDNPAGPPGPAIIPGEGGEPGHPSSCSPQCDENGLWTGCGLDAPKNTGTSCGACPAVCSDKGEVGEGWYDCRGVVIVATRCR